MKKIIVFLLSLTLWTGFIPLHAFAQQDSADSVNLIESIENIQKLKNFRFSQKISGQLLAENESSGLKSVTGDFWLSLVSDEWLSQSYEYNSNIKLGFEMNVKLEGPDRPVDSAKMAIRADLIYIQKDALYARLLSADITAQGIRAEDMEAYNEFRTQILDGVRKIRSKWIRIPLNPEETKNNQISLVESFDRGFNAQIPDELKEIMDGKTFRTDMRKYGIKKAYQRLLTKFIDKSKKEGTMTDEEYDQAKKLIDLFFKSEFFTTKKIKMGRVDWTSFSFSKNLLWKFVTNVSKILKEDLTENEKADLRNGLEKFKLNGAYKVNEALRIFDRFKLKLIVKDIEELKRLVINYDYSITRVNELKKLEKPSKFTESSEIENSFSEDSASQEPALELDLVPME